MRRQLPPCSTKLQSPRLPESLCRSVAEIGLMFHVGLGLGVLRACMVKWRAQTCGCSMKQPRSLVWQRARAGQWLLGWNAEGAVCMA